MEYYADQLDAIVDLIKVLNEWEQRHTGSSDCGVMIKNKIILTHPEEVDTPLGYLVDEIGGVWAFQPYSVIDETLKTFKGES